MHMRLTRSWSRRMAAGAMAVAAITGISACSSSDPGSSSTTQSTGQHMTASSFSAALKKTGTIVLDVRTPAEFASGHLPQAQNIDIEASDFATRIAALDKNGRRATLEAGGMRLSLAVEDLEPASGGAEAGPPEAGSRSTSSSAAQTPSSAARLQLERARTVASSLDLRGAKVQEALEVLDRYLDDASLAGLDQVTIIHGMGTGALRDSVRDHAAGHPLVRSWRPGDRGEGGDGATIVSL